MQFEVQLTAPLIHSACCTPSMPIRTATRQLLLVLRAFYTFYTATAAHCEQNQPALDFCAMLHATADCAAVVANCSGQPRVPQCMSLHSGTCA
jgi:hypothetical protein